MKSLAPVAKIQKEGRDVRQLWMDRFHHLFAGKHMLTPAEVAKALGISGKSVERLYDEGQLLGHKLNCGGKGERFIRRISRESAIRYLAMTAEYTPEDFLEGFAHVILERSTNELRALQDKVAAELQRRGDQEPG